MIINSGNANSVTGRIGEKHVRKRLLLRRRCLIAVKIISVLHLQVLLGFRYQLIGY